MTASTLSVRDVLPHFVGGAAVAGGIAVAVVVATPAAIVAGSILAALGALFIICVIQHKNSIYNIPGEYTSSLLKFTAFWIAAHYTDNGPLQKWESELTQKGASSFLQSDSNK